MTAENILLRRIHVLEGAVLALARQIDALEARKASKPAPGDPNASKTKQNAPATPQTTLPEPKTPKSALELAELAAATRFADKKTFESFPGWDYASMAGPKPKPIPPRKAGYVPIDLEKIHKGVGAHVNRHRKHQKR